MRTAKERIKKVAFELICKRQLLHVTTEQVIKEAEIAKASFYYHFQDKYDLAAQIFEDKVLSPFISNDSSVSWSSRILDAVAHLRKYKTFCRNLFNEDVVKYMYLDLAQFYCDAFSTYMVTKGANVDNIAIKKAIQNVAQTDLLVVYQYCNGKIHEEGLIKLGECWAETAPYILHDYIG